MSTARYRIRNLTTSGAWSDFDDAGFDAAAGDELELQLEASPALDIHMTQFLCTDRSAGRTAPVFDPVTGIAATPTTGVSMTLPAGEVGTWAIECQTNGGGDGTVDSAADNRKTRYVAVRTANLDLRHPLAGETSQYVGAGGWAVALQELQDAVDVGAAGAVPATRTITAGAGLTGGGNLSADRTIDVAVNADGGLVVTANELQLGALGFARVATALAAASASIAVNSQKITGLLDPTNPQEAATKAYVDSVAGGVPTTRTLTTTAPLRIDGGGSADLSANRTFTFAPTADVAMLGFGFTGVTGLANAGSTIAIATGSETAWSLGYGTITGTLTGILDQKYDGLTTTKTVARRLRQTTASDGVNTIRFSPSEDAEGHARVGGIDRTFLYRFTPIEPAVAGSMVARWERDIGSGYGDMFQWVSASPVQALAGIYVARLIISSTSGGLWFDASNNRVIVGASGGMQMISADGDDPQILRSAVAGGSTDAIRSWANGETKTSAQAIHAFGSGTTYAGVSAVRGDGVYHGPAMHFESLVTAISLDAKVCTSYEIDATTCVTVHLDQALAAYDGYEIEVINLGTSTNTVTFDVTSGGASTNIIDAGVSASTKTASGAGFVIRFKCLGGDGWVITRRYLC